MTGLTCCEHAEEARPTSRCMRRWEKTKSRAVISQETLYLVVYDVETRSHMGWGSALPSPVNSWETPEKILDERSTLCKTYRTGAILDIQDLRAFQKSTGMTACRKRPVSVHDYLAGLKKKLLPAFERLLSLPLQEDRAMVEMAGSPSRDNILSQRAYVLPFLVNPQASYDTCELVEEAYQQLSSSQ